jgi:hypothetical protein
VYNYLFSTDMTLGHENFFYYLSTLHDSQHVEVMMNTMINSTPCLSLLPDVPDHFRLERCSLWKRVSERGSYVFVCYAFRRGTRFLHGVRERGSRSHCDVCVSILVRWEDGWSATHQVLRIDSLRAVHMFVPNRHFLDSRKLWGNRKFYGPLVGFVSVW